MVYELRTRQSVIKATKNKENIDRNNNNSIHLQKEQGSYHDYEISSVFRRRNCSNEGSLRGSSNNILRNTHCFRRENISHPLHYNKNISSKQQYEKLQTTSTTTSQHSSHNFRDFHPKFEGFENRSCINSATSQHRKTRNFQNLHINIESYRGFEEQQQQQRRNEQYHRFHSPHFSSGHLSKSKSSTVNSAMADSSNYFRFSPRITRQFKSPLNNPPNSSRMAPPVTPREQQTTMKIENKKKVHGKIEKLEQRKESGKFYLVLQYFVFLVSCSFTL